MAKSFAEIKAEIQAIVESIYSEDTVKQNNKWVNKGKEGTHGTFKTKKAADAQRKAMFANGYHEETESSEENIEEIEKK